MNAERPTPSAPPPPPAPAAPRPLPWRRLAAGMAGYVASVALTIVLVAGAATWLLTTSQGTAWLLRVVPGIEVDEPDGALLGDFSARQVRTALPGEGAALRIDGLSWRGLVVSSPPGRAWLRIDLAELNATRVEVTPSTEPSRDLPPPGSLALPVELRLAALRIGELRITGVDTPLRGLRAALHLGAADGAEHRVDAAAGSWDRLGFEGRARVATAGDLDLQARIELRQSADAGTDWNATVAVDGPLAAPRAQAVLRARPGAAREPQSLDLSATLHPFAAWPLGELQATARVLDLQSLHSDAPRTALDIDLRAATTAANRPAQLTATVGNRDAGRWNEGRLPVRSVQVEASARPDAPDKVELQRFTLEAGSARAAAGRVSGSGRWEPTQWALALQIDALRPALLDARAPDMSVGGRLQVDGRGFGGVSPGAAQVDLRGDLVGQLRPPGGGSGATRAVQLALDATLGELRVDLRRALARAGTAQASLSGRATRTTASAPWSAQGQATLADFDPSAWWPGPTDSPWRAGPHRIDAHAAFDVALAAPRAAGPQPPWLARLRGRAEVGVDPSTIAGVPLSGEVKLQTAPDGTLQLQARLDADGNHVSAEGRVDPAGDGSADRWQASAAMPALDRLQPLLRLAQGGDAKFAGSVQGDATWTGRWPAVAGRGQLVGDALRFGDTRAMRAVLLWDVGSGDDGALEASATVVQAAAGRASAEAVQLHLQGTKREHRFEVVAQSRGLPPAWVEAVRAAPGGALATRTIARVQLQGGFVAAGATPLAGWRGRLRQAEIRGNAAGAPAWAAIDDVALSWLWGDGPAKIHVDAGRVDVVGAALRWSRVDWTAAEPGHAPTRVDVQAELEPIDVAPLLALAQPDFGWGGDLRVEGRIVVRSAPTFAADVVVQRAGGDLSVTDDSGTRSLGLTDLRIGLGAADGVWSFSAALAGQTLGQAAGAVVVRTRPDAAWPAADAPIDGVLEMRVADLGVLGRWLPAGWRLRGDMRVGAAIGGRFGAPQYEGELTGRSIEVRNVLQGVDVRDGEVAIALRGDTARVERFGARAGSGTLALDGGASFGERPQAELRLRLDRFQLLGRVDRRVVVSGDARLRFSGDELALDGALGIDEGLIDFSRSDAPTLSEDVTIKRPGAPEPAAVAAGEEAPARAPGRPVVLDLRVDMGERLRVRGRGLDTGLRGDLRFSAPQRRLRVDGTLRTVGGTYRAYRQNLVIDRGVLTFVGPVENPQLDIEATRPNLDVRVGVAVTGTVLVPRVRLFSDPPMSDAEKLSWLIRGRPPEGPEGGADTALLQAAAAALVAGEEGATPVDEVFRLIGIDDLAVRQNEAGTGGAVVSVGKQLSRDWYVGYERGLNAATGTWQVVYRIAQRFTVRAKSGEQNSLELIWTWRWN